MKYKIWFSPTSRAEILEAFEYIRSDQHAPLNAAHWLDGIIGAINKLNKFPRAYGLARESEEFKEELRQCIYKSHRIIFDVAGNRIRIHRVVHTARRNITPGELRRPSPRK